MNEWTCKICSSSNGKHRTTCWSCNGMRNAARPTIATASVPTTFPVEEKAKSPPSTTASILTLVLLGMAVWVGVTAYKTLTEKEVLDSNNAQHNVSEAGVQVPFPITPDVLKIGSTFKTNLLQIEISEFFVGPTVGSNGFQSKASEGATYVGILFNYKNIGTKPVSFINKPKITLRSSDGITYNPDVQATIAYSFDAKVDEKAISDLNPGIKVYGAHIFEVSKELFDARTWNVLVDADKLAIVKF